MFDRSSSPSQPRRVRWARFARQAGVGGALFAAGYLAAVAGAPYATFINAGLVNALDLVGKNLFGEAVFSAFVQPNPPPIQPNPVRIDIATDTLVPAALGIFVPPNPVQPTDPCRRIAQMIVQPGGIGGDGGALPPSLTLYYDPSRLIPVPTFPPDPIRPNLARCTAAHMP